MTQKGRHRRGLFALPGLSVGAGIDDAGVGGEFKGRHLRGEGLLLLHGYCGVHSICCGVGLLNWGIGLGETERECMTLPLNRDGKPGYTGVVAEEEGSG